MEAGTFATVVIAGTLALALIPGWVAYRRRELFWTDVGIVLAPTFVFVLAAAILNPDTRVGWALIIYPFLALMLSVLLVYVRIFALAGPVCNARICSALCLALGCAAAFIAGVTIPPLYE
ncbi:MAG TPA: hypothetical protein VKP89_13655 [Burkholderiales bacterium]|nr:hypothetical protein [Burkholderiales bacterium]